MSDTLSPIPSLWIQEVADHYIIGTLWANTYTDPDGEPMEYGGGEFNPAPWLDKIDQATEEAMRREASMFVESNWDDVRTLDPKQVGHDFALTRNHHGAGFWDRGLGEVGERLTKAAQAYGEYSLYFDGDTFWEG